MVHIIFLPTPPAQQTHTHTLTASSHSSASLSTRVAPPRLPHLIPPILDESGFMEVECFTILYMVTTRKMTLTCQNRCHIRVNRTHLGSHVIPAVEQVLRSFTVTLTLCLISLILYMQIEILKLKSSQCRKQLP